MSYKLLFCVYLFAQVDYVLAADSSRERTSFALAQAYEAMEDLVKAEEQYAMAAQTENDALRAQSIAGLRRTHDTQRQRNDTNALRLAQAYERVGLWEKSRDEYASVIRNGNARLLAHAVAGFQRTNERLALVRWSAGRDALLAWLGCMVLGVLVPVWTFQFAKWMHTVRKSIRVTPFLADTTEAGNQMKYWLGYIRAQLRRSASSTGDLVPGWSELPLIELPDLPSGLTDVGDLQFGDQKLGLKETFAFLARPKIQVSGGWTSGAADGHAYAEIERRLWGGYGVSGTVVRSISTGTQSADLELFSYDVLIHAISAQE